MTGPAILAAVQATLRAADIGMPVRFANEGDGWGWRAGVSVEIAEGPAAEWIEVTMPRLDEQQVTSSPRALVGNPDPEPLMYIRHFGPTGRGASAGLAAVEAVGLLFAGTSIGDALGGVDFLAGVGTQQLSVGPAGSRPGLYFQVQGWVRGTMLFTRAA